MKQVVDVNVGGFRFSLEEDAHSMLNEYLNRFAKSMKNKNESDEVMVDVEMRIAELFQKEIKLPNQVVTLTLVKEVIECLGEVDEEPNLNNTCDNTFQEKKTIKRLYRNTEDKNIAGVCSGLGIYFGIDATLIRIVLLIALLCYGTGILMYVILWIALPEAKTIVQKMEMRGIPVTAENIKKFTAERAASNF